MPEGRYQPRSEMPRNTGIGLRAPHTAAIIATRPAVGWLEVHAENYMGLGPAFRALERLRSDYPLSIHGVGLSLGCADGIDEGHLSQLKLLTDELQPFLLSEHLAWCGIDGVYLNDLLPLPYTEEVLDLLVEHVDKVQSRLGRRILIENPSAYLRFRHSTIPEPEFLAALVARSGCGLLCDINNIYVSGRNLQFDPIAYLAALPAAAIGEFHLAGHQENAVGDTTILIDDHGSAIGEAVWTLHAQALRLFGRRPTLVEWDSHLPPLDILVAEAAKVDDLTKSVTRGPGDVEAA